MALKEVLFTKKRRVFCLAYVQDNIEQGYFGSLTV